MKILFLDFDGVINSVRSATAFGGFPWNIAPESLKLFDPVSLSLIRKLCSENDIKIVISSTWRKCFTCEALAEALQLPIIDTTIIRYSEKSRGEEIKEWLVNHPEITDYVIIDDDSDMLEEQKPRFVHTNPYDGLRWQDYLKIKKLFKLEVK